MEQEAIISGRRVKLSVFLIILFMIISSDMYKETVTFEKYGEYSRLISCLVIVCGFLIIDISHQFDII